MVRKELPQALTLERFATGKDGRANAFKKKKQANKRKLFEKAQLKRQYAKLLKKEAMVAGDDGSGDAQSGGQVRNDIPTGRVTSSPERKQKQRTKAREVRQRHDPHKKRDDREREEDAAIDGQQEQQQQHSKTGKLRRPGHRPDPFKAAKATADQRRREAGETKRKRDMQVAEKEGRAKKRRKQHALLSQRTRG
ncbi:unnamed protein product, partial [Hapterophycus canaliculatus]